MQIATCAVCQVPLTLFKKGGRTTVWAWIQERCEDQCRYRRVPVCKGACLRALAKWKRNKR